MCKLRSRPMPVKSKVSSISRSQDNYLKFASQVLLIRLTNKSLPKSPPSMIRRPPLPNKFQTPPPAFSAITIRQRSRSIKTPSEMSCNKPTHWTRNCRLRGKQPKPPCWVWPANSSSKSPLQPTHSLNSSTKSGRNSNKNHQQPYNRRIDCYWWFIRSPFWKDFNLCVK